MTLSMLKGVRLQKQQARSVIRKDGEDYVALNNLSSGIILRKYNPEILTRFKNKSIGEPCQQAVIVQQYFPAL